MNNCSYDLPKVKIRFKTTPSEFNRPSLDISKFDRFEASPTIFIDRLKHGKQIHESFMKNRKLKKHNYIKQLFGHKKTISNNQPKSMNSTNIPNKLVDGEFKKFDISLETTAYKKRPAQHNQIIRRNRLKDVRKNIKDLIKDDIQQGLIISFKNRTVSIKPQVLLSQQGNLYKSATKTDSNLLQIDNFRWNYELEKKKHQNIIRQFKKSRKNMKQSLKSINFQIEAWKSDQIFANQSYQNKINDIDYF